MPKTLVKLRRTPSDAPRPASTPPVIAASAVHDEDEEEKIMAELEVRFGPASDFCCYLLNSDSTDCFPEQQRYFRERRLKTRLVSNPAELGLRPPLLRSLGLWADR